MSDNEQKQEEMFITGHLFFMLFSFAKFY